MATKTITWSDGSTATLAFNGQGNGTIVVTGDPNNHYESRSAQVTVRTTDGSNISKTLTIVQAAKVRIDISSAIVTAAKQTYSGSAKTPTPTVTLNGETVPSSGYDVAYSDNINAGTATITITGKGDYTGTATGTFTIAKANPTYTAPTTRTGLTYSGSSQYLVNAGSTSHGTIQYSSDGTTWSTTRPSSTNAGSYTTYWRLVGDSNHNDVASTSLSTTIAKASRTLSFADTYVVLAPSGNITKTATPSAGSGDGAITYSISNTTYATINSSSGKVTAKTSDGSAIVTATIAEGTNYLSASASYNLYVFATTHNYDYNGSYRDVALPPGTYQFQCWGAQGGANGVNATYGIIAQAGGKGGYSIGQLTISQPTNIKVYVGGQGSYNTAGFNGGGSSSDYSQYDSGDEFGFSKFGGGGGATDIRLSDGALLSRMIVAGGGSGGAMYYKHKTETITTWDTLVDNWTIEDSTYQTKYVTSFTVPLVNVPLSVGDIVRVVIDSTSANTAVTLRVMDSADKTRLATYISNVKNNKAPTGTIDTIPTDAGAVLSILIVSDLKWFTAATLQKQVTTQETTVTRESQVGFVGGGTSGGGYSSTYQGKQNAAGTGGSFGQGANQTANNYRYCSAGGGGGWYGGGGGQKSDSSMTTVKYSGGGSGFVNTSASAGNRPSGYTGLQLDSGTTYAGNTSFVAPGGGNETGHSGNGYARITRLS